MLLFQAEAKKAEQRDSSRMGQGGNMAMGGAQMNSGYNRGQFGYPQMPGKELFYHNFCLILLHFLVWFCNIFQDQTMLIIQTLNYSGIT